MTRLTKKQIAFEVLGLKTVPSKGISKRIVDSIHKKNLSDSELKLISDSYNSDIKSGIGKRVSQNNLMSSLTQEALSDYLEQRDPETSGIKSLIKEEFSKLGSTEFESDTDRTATEFAETEFAETETEMETGTESEEEKIESLRRDLKKINEREKEKERKNIAGPIGDLLDSEVSNFTSVLSDLTDDAKNDLKNNIKRSALKSVGKSDQEIDDILENNLSGPSDQNFLSAISNQTAGALGASTSIAALEASVAFLFPEISIPATIIASAAATGYVLGSATESYIETSISNYLRSKPVLSEVEVPQQDQKKKNISSNVDQAILNPETLIDTIPELEILLPESDIEVQDQYQDQYQDQDQVQDQDQILDENLSFKEDPGSESLTETSFGGQAIFKESTRGLKGSFYDPIHIDALGLFFDNAYDPNWDHTLFASRSISEPSEEYLLEQSKMIVANNGPKILVPFVRYSLGSGLVKKENQEILQLWMSYTNNRKGSGSGSGSGSDSVSMKVSDLKLFADSLVSDPLTRSTGQPKELVVEVKEEKDYFKTYKKKKLGQKERSFVTLNPFESTVQKTSGLKYNENVNVYRQEKILPTDFSRSLGQSMLGFEGPTVHRKRTFGKDTFKGNQAINYSGSN